ncbi:dUTP diphosphatase [symbiont of Argiope bruennichi]|uniref:dUTP diphosphatase n=1 Tax=symbiont of Argiope bruennichi TaxID=2810479 RepID=UPI003DA585C2
MQTNKFDFLLDIFKKQSELDKFILENTKDKIKNLLEKKILSFTVEVAELCNETRCFKYWSKKSPSSKEILLDEYADGLHFLVSIGIALGLTKIIPQPLEDFEKCELFELFNHIFLASSIFLLHANSEHGNGYYQNLFNFYYFLGQKLNFSDHEIHNAYCKKNQINYERQKNNY